MRTRQRAEIRLYIYKLLLLQYMLILFQVSNSIVIFPITLIKYFYHGHFYLIQCNVRLKTVKHSTVTLIIHNNTIILCLLFKCMFPLTKLKRINCTTTQNAI